MSKYFYKLYVGPGRESTGLIESDLNEANLYDYLRAECIQFADSYGYYQDEDYFGGSLDQVGANWDDEEECYEDERELEYYFEDYDSEEHDGQVYAVEFEVIL